MKTSAIVLRDDALNHPKSIKIQKESEWVCLTIGHSQNHVGNNFPDSNSNCLKFMYSIYIYWHDISYDIILYPIETNNYYIIDIISLMFHLWFVESPRNLDTTWRCSYIHPPGKKTCTCISKCSKWLNPDVLTLTSCHVPSFLIKTLFSYPKVWIISIVRPNVNWTIMVKSY